MKTKMLTTVTLSGLMLALAPLSYGSAMNDIEIAKVREVLRGLGYPESTLSNSELEQIRNSGSDMNAFSSSIESYKADVDSGIVSPTCGAGTHGSDKDPGGK